MFMCKFKFPVVVFLCNPSADDEDDAVEADTTPARKSTPRRPQKQSLLALPAFPSPPPKTPPEISSPADVIADVTTPAPDTPGSASRFLASRARSKLTRREARPLPEPSSTFPVSEVASLDLLSTYGFLRSFSQALYLTPFTLDEFLGALGCERPNPLMDAVHLVLMEALRQRVEELLAKEGAWEVMFLRWGPVLLLSVLQPTLEMDVDVLQGALEVTFLFCQGFLFSKCL
jgi:hypothetical protein